jgi:hypothetical protein
MATAAGQGFIRVARRSRTDEGSRCLSAFQCPKTAQDPTSLGLERRAPGLLEGPGGAIADHDLAPLLSR